jgi:hypothetical protein
MIERNMKPKTIFSDIDGTLVHQVQFEEINPYSSVALPGAVEKMNQWYNEGHHIVLTTARPEYLRNTTVLEMALLGIPFHQLVMGIGRAERILINNASEERPEEKRAIAFQVEKNGGLENVNI